MAQENVCSFNKYGFCKFGETCRRRHISEKCYKKSCEVRKCSLRHPRICKFYRDFGYCKFGEWCCFVHKTSNDDKVKELSDKMKTMENKCSDLEKQLAEKDGENKHLGEEIDRKIEAFESKMSTIIQSIKEKDDAIASLEKKLDDLENNLASKVVEKKKKKIFKCTNCNYESSSDQGLKIHIARKHTVNKLETSSICELIRNLNLQANCKSI